VAEAEVVGVGRPPVGDSSDRPLLVELVRDGKVVGREPLEVARERHLASRAELPRAAQMMSRGEPVIPTEHLTG
jgi:nicotinate phosphoribosyltransferase